MSLSSVNGARSPEPTCQLSFADHDEVQRVQQRRQQEADGPKLQDHLFASIQENTTDTGDGDDGDPAAERKAVELLIERLGTGDESRDLRAEHVADELAHD